MKIRKSTVYIAINVLSIVGFIVNHLNAGETYSENSIIILAIIGYLFGFTITELGYLFGNKEKNSIIYEFEPFRKKIVTKKTDQESSTAEASGKKVKPRRPISREATTA